MKTAIVILALMFTGTAHASKARVAALSAGAHLADFQTVFASPKDVHNIAEQATFEFGATTATLNADGSTTGSQGGFVKKTEGAVWAFYLGREAASMNYGFLKIDSTFATFLAEENPFDVVYGAAAGDMKYAVLFHYSNADKKSVSRKSNNMGLTFGLQSGDWNAQLGLGLAGGSTNSATTGTDVKMTLSPAMVLSGGNWMGEHYVYGAYTSLGAKKETGTTENAKHARTDIQLGYVRETKKDGHSFFYGAEYMMRAEKESVADVKLDETTLPVKFGVEADAASWLVLRASLSQNVLLGSTKTTTAGTGNANTIANNTVVAAGLGLKFGKFLMDGTIQNANAGTGTLGFDGANFITNTSINYTF